MQVGYKGILQMLQLSQVRYSGWSGADFPGAGVVIHFCKDLAFCMELSWYAGG